MIDPGRKAVAASFKTATSSFRITQADSAHEIAQARALFLEYAESLGFSLCFQGFDKELAGLPGDYAPPSGRLLLAERMGRTLGCVALHRLKESDHESSALCEMKRLYVRPEARGSGVGLALAEAIIAAGREIGYSAMRLDTVAGKMDSAIKMYRGLGFREIPAYCDNPIPGALYMELKL